ncbi:uncharacterized protein LOC124449486 [Xenia sp. Carnegie-2017]|uniref:uncharacterized protein LOC124449486 n=1 Tax=Xenia sp. Carnegie-2017 TaxID=2897299 RepID=UPI001F047282|nr:uncharacterized protein LOC124449486 [Xenia sp. Carnegie-2017]XP_046856372.1 uncharacterized protein LOC124449486 [Xenia sp. Carnegie-2017]
MMSFVRSKKSQNLNQYALLSNLEDQVEKLKASPQTINDENISLQCFCATLEQIFLEGARRSVLIFKQKHYWHWISEIPKYLQSCGSNDLKLTYIINTVDNATKSWSMETKGRQFIRMALVKKCLHKIVELLDKNISILQNFYTYESFLSTTHLRESLLAHLKEISNLDFDLNLKAVQFLNETWIIPKIHEILTVPCDQLGITISQVDERAMVAFVLTESIADENNIDVGDCILSMCGKDCCGQTVEKVAEILKQNQGQPIPISIAKMKLANGELFLPLLRRKKVLDSEDSNLQKHPNKTAGDKKIQSQISGYNETPVHGVSKGNLYFQANYIGKHKTGETGDLNSIEPSILEVVDQRNTPLAVLVKLAETSIEILDEKSNKTLAVHSYTVTSACGRGKVHTNTFAYISGDTTCTISKDFTCYVFTVESENQAREAVYGIAQGFNRTLWYV